MKIDLKIIVFVGVFAIMFWTLVTFKPKPVSHTPSPEQLPKESPIKPKPELEPKPGQPEKPEMKLPAKGVALPNAPVFSKTKKVLRKQVL